MLEFPDDIDKHAKTILIFLIISGGIGFISDLSYIYPGIHLLKFVGFVIGMALLINVTIIQTFIIDHSNFGFAKILSFNITGYTFGMIIYYAGRNLSGNYFPSLISLSYFGIIQVIYHTSEFAFVAICHTKTLSWSSFLINHSKSYTFAMILCMIEYGLETYYNLFPKNYQNIRLAGLVMVTIGMLLRIGAFISAGSNFTHLIADYKKPKHQLITKGVYAICRHPSYLGWFLFTISNQIILQNPICLIGFTIASWQFFYDRIKYEEYTLLSFFGQDYDNYRQKTPILIPFIDFLLTRNKTSQYPKGHLYVLGLTSQIIRSDCIVKKDI